MPSPSDKPGLEARVRAALDGVKDPVSGKGLVASGRVSGLVVRPDGKVGFVLETAVGAADEQLRKAAEAAESDDKLKFLDDPVTSDLKIEVLN